MSDERRGSARFSHTDPVARGPSGTTRIASETGNGSVTVALPRDFEGEVEARSGHGEVHSDFPITITGPIRSGHLRGVIGRGGPRIRMSTGNGRLELRRID